MTRRLDAVLREQFEFLLAHAAQCRAPLRRKPCLECDRCYRMEKALLAPFDEIVYERRKPKRRAAS